MKLLRCFVLRGQLPFQPTRSAFLGPVAAAQFSKKLASQDIRQTFKAQQRSYVRDEEAARLQNDYFEDEEEEAFAKKYRLSFEAYQEEQELAQQIVPEKSDQELKIEAWTEALKAEHEQTHAAFLDKKKELTKGKKTKVDEASIYDHLDFNYGESHNTKLVKITGGKTRIKFSIPEKHYHEEFSKGFGPGGQKTNKSNNCVILTHKPTGIQVKCHDARLQETNRRIARKQIIDLLDVHVNGATSREHVRIEKAQKQKSRKLSKQKKRQREAKEAREAKAEELRMKTEILGGAVVPVEKEEEDFDMQGIEVGINSNSSEAEEEIDFENLVFEKKLTKRRKRMLRKRGKKNYF